MSIYMHPRNLATYREQTNKPCTMTSTWRFTCKTCHEAKPLGGRKSRGPGQGYDCAECAKKKH